MLPHKTHVCIRIQFTFIADIIVVFFVFSANEGIGNAITIVIGNNELEVGVLVGPFAAIVAERLFVVGIIGVPEALLDIVPSGG